MDDLSLQVDEIEALVAIYDKEWQTTDEENRAYCINIRNGDGVVRLYIKLPSNYPSSVSPTYEISAPHLSESQKNHIHRLLDEVCLTNLGQNVIFQLVEKVREVLQFNFEGSAWSELESWPESEEINIVEPQKMRPNNAEYECPDILHGGVIMDRKSSFQGHAAIVHSVKQVEQVIHKLLETKKIQQATHNVYAYRIYRQDVNCFLQDCEDDGETQAGSRLLHLLQVMGVKDVVVIVSRWYGGIQLGPDRFRHINNAAREKTLLHIVDCTVWFETLTKKYIKDGHFLINPCETVVTVHMKFLYSILPIIDKPLRFNLGFNSSVNGIRTLKFAQDYANEISLYMDDFVYTKEVHQSPSLKMLVSFAEKEFHREFSKPPTYAVYAPGCVNLCGESEDFNDGKILSMATQLVTVIVGTRRATSRVCKIKTLLREKGEENYAKFSINTSGLDTSSQVTWVNYVKAVIRNFRVSKEYIPGFKALIVSSIPIKRGLGSSSALIVAMYTLLEVITKVYTTNTLEKSIACQQAEKIAMSVSCGIWKTLLPIVGIEGKIMEFDSRLLEIQEHVWSPLDIDLIFITSTEDAIDTLVYQKYLNQCREVAFALNLISLRDATIPKLATVGQLFSSSSLKAACHVINETDRVTTAGQLIDHCHWKKLGNVMWESHCSMRDNFGSSCSQIERIMSMIQNIPGVYGARIVGRDFGTIVLALVHRHAVRTMVNALRSGDQCQEYQVVKPSSGSGILYADTNEQLLPIVSNKKRLRKSHRNNLFVGDYNDYHQQYDTIYGVRDEKTFTPVKEIYTKY